MIRLLISFVQWALRIPLLVAGALGLIAFLHLVSKQGNVFLLYDEKIRNIPFLLESTEQWIPFLGGEFAFSVVLPLAVHLVLASSDGGRSLSTFFVLSILAGLWIAHGVAFRFAKSGEEMMLLIDNQKHINKLMAVAALYCIFDRKSQKPRINLNAPVWLFVLVKAVGILLIVTAVFVISMGTSAQDPSDLLPKLIWEGKGYRYDMLETYGEEETALNFKFFYLIVSTMLATISQTLCIGVWVDFQLEAMKLAEASRSQRLGLV